MARKKQPQQISIDRPIVFSRAGGLPPEQFLALSDNDQLIAVLDNLQAQCEETLKSERVLYTAENREAADIQTDCLRILRAIKRCRKHIEEDKTALAVLEAFEIGRSLESVTTHLVLHQGFYIKDQKSRDQALRAMKKHQEEKPDVEARHSRWIECARQLKEDRPDNKTLHIARLVIKKLNLDKGEKQVKNVLKKKGGFP